MSLTHQEEHAIHLAVVQLWRGFDSRQDKRRAGTMLRDERAAFRVYFESLSTWIGDREAQEEAAEARAVELLGEENLATIRRLGAATQRKLQEGILQLIQEETPILELMEAETPKQDTLR